MRCDIARSLQMAGRDMLHLQSDSRRHQVFSVFCLLPWFYITFDISDVSAHAPTLLNCNAPLGDTMVEPIRIVVLLLVCVAFLLLFVSQPIRRP